MGLAAPSASWYRLSRAYHMLLSLNWSPHAAAGDYHSRPDPPSPRGTPFTTKRTSINGNAVLLMLQYACVDMVVQQAFPRYT